VALIVAYRSDLSAEHLDLLLNARPSTTVAEHLAYQEIGHEQLGEACAEALARSPSPGLRNYAAQSPRLPVEMLAKLSKDLHTPTRLSVANHGSTPPQVLKALTLDRDREVLLTAEDRLARTTALRPLENAAPGLRAGHAPSRDRKPFLQKLSNFFKD
jgi:hypothetical protein